MFRKRGKKGISPLIATVLLIAFAVSIGTMIMNWGRDVPAAEDCKDVKIELQTINGKPLFCYDTLNTKINVMLKNTGNVDVAELRLLVTSASGSDFSKDEKNIENSPIKSGETVVKNIVYVKSGKFKVEIAPIISVGGTEKACLDKSVVAEDIQACT